MRGGGMSGFPLHDVTRDTGSPWTLKAGFARAGHRRDKLSWDMQEEINLTSWTSGTFQSQRPNWSEKMLESSATFRKLLFFLVLCRTHSDIGDHDMEGDCRYKLLWLTCTPPLSVENSIRNYNFFYHTFILRRFWHTSIEKQVFSPAIFLILTDELQVWQK